jgi:MATE family multidrug resistance protein
VNRTHDRQIARLAIPALAALAADPLTSLVDTLFVGRVGTRALAALGVDAAIFGLAFFAFNFLAYGVTPLVSAALGAGDTERAARVVGTGLVLAAGIGIMVVVGLEALAGPVLAAMGAEGPLAEEAMGYLRIRALAAPAVLIVTLGHGAFRGFHDTRTPLFITVGLNVVNLILDPVLIFGLDWGLEGAAVATVVAQWVGAIWFLFAMRRRLGIELDWREVSELRRIGGVGVHNFVRTLALLVAITATTRVATTIGESAVAAHQIALQILFFLALTIDALAIAAQAMVSRHLGEGRVGLAREVSDRLLVLGFGFGSVLAVALFLSAGVVPGIFTDDRAVTSELESIWLLLSVLQVPGALVYVWDGIVMGAVDFRYLARAMLMASVAALAVLALVGPQDWGLVGVWWALMVLNLGRLATLALWYFGRWSRLAPG